MFTRSLAWVVLTAGIASSTFGQAVRTQPYNAQLRTDPAVGNVQGIQRYGRPLATDPDEGEGFSYHVYPTTPESRVVVASAGQVPNQSTAPRATAGPSLPATAVIVAPPGGPAVPYPPPFNPTVGRRLAPLLAPAPGSAAAAATGGDGGGTALLPIQGITHQPLIQVKVRVVEVDRSKSLQVSSVLDYIRSPFTGATLITGNNINQNTRNLTGSTRFPTTSNLIDFMGGNSIAALTGAGALINLTTGNLNYIARLLQNEFHADIITAPEVVTLNGQNVEFVAGQKVPFSLGQNVIQGNNNNIQQFFYKHVGTYISVTPQIVNWGTGYGSGGGRASLIDADVNSWRRLVTTFMEKLPLFMIPPGDPLYDYIGFAQTWLNQHPKPCDELPVPATIKERILTALNQCSKDVIVQYFADCLKPRAVETNGCGPACDWRPEDCTIDLNVVMRLSTTGDTTVGVSPAGSAPVSVSVPIEDNVRGIANIVQVQSGHGVIMGGMIGEQQVKDVDRVPVLGDIPVIGALFRSTSTTRHKTEVLLFIEARVLDANPLAARGQSAEDFVLGQPFVAGGFLDNPLEFGMYRAGFGTYLPPHSPEEKIFWERLGRKIRNMATTLDDIFE